MCYIVTNHGDIYRVWNYEMLGSMFAEIYLRQETVWFLFVNFLSTYRLDELGGWLAQIESTQQEGKSK